MEVMVVEDNAVTDPSKCPQYTRKLKARQPVGN